MTGNQERFQQAMKQGNSAAWDQSWDRAIIFYRQALEEIPDQPNALSNLGLAYYELQNYKEAMKVYQRAAEVSPQDPVPCEKVAELLEKLGKPDQAAEVFMKAAELYAKLRDTQKAMDTWNRVVRIKPEHLMAHSRLGLVYERVGQKEQAVNEYLAMASILQSRGDPGKAIQAVTHALQVLPKSAKAAQALDLLRLGRQLPRLSRPASASDKLVMEPIRQLGPQKSPGQTKNFQNPIDDARQRALSQLAGLLFDQSEEDSNPAARRGLEAIVQGAVQAVSSGPRQYDRTQIMLHLSQAVDLQSHGEDEQASEELGRAMNAGLSHAAAYYDLGFLYLKSEKYEDGIGLLQRAMGHPDFAVASHLLLGQAYHKLDHLQEAATEFLEALKLADAQMVPADQAEELRQLYDPLIEVQDQQTAEYHRQVCQNISEMLVKPNWQENLLRARQQLPRQPAGSPPVPLAEILTESRGGKVVESITKIHQLARAGYHRAAMEEAFYALQHAPTYLPLHTFIGELLLQQDRVQNAVEKFNVVAQSYSSRGEPRRAIEIYRKIVDLAPMDMQSRESLISQLLAMGQPDAAVLEYMNLADVYYSQADLASARKTYMEAMRMAQQSNVDRAVKVKILHRVADIDMQSLDWRKALRIYEQIRSLQPGDEKSRTSIIELNFRLGQSLPAITELDDYLSFLISSKQKDQAILFLENIAAENPKVPQVHRRLAELYRQVGRVSDAVNELDTVGDQLITAGDKPGAIEAIMAILSLNPPNAAEYQRLLARIKGV